MKIIVGEGSCGIAAGAGKIHQTLEQYIKRNSLDITLGVSGCIGMCFLEPIIDIHTTDGLLRLVKVSADNIKGLLHFLSDGDKSHLNELLIKDEDAEFLNKQTRIALRNCGLVNPERIEDYLAAGGYAALAKAVSIKPEEVISEMKLSGLAGRGGAGFPTWFKWEAARKSTGDEKYLICNADEGDPGAFMDRAVIEGDPHSLIEGMLIAAYVIGCRKAYVYVRAEYPLAIQRLQTALEQAAAAGYVGAEISGSGFSCQIVIKQGAGAFVCGEETALIESIEGHRGMPRLKPPYPAQCGLWGKPSNINNVETFANVPWIIQHSGKAFAALGTAGSKGTKVFAITGKVKRGGLVEIPMGSTLGDVIMDIGGGIRDGKRWKAVQLGGPSGGCVPATMADTVIDYAALCATGAIMGSGGMVVMDESTCMVAMARFFLDFTAKESCGKCVHCRIGTKRLLEILDRIVSGQGQPGDIDLLESLSVEVKAGSLCGLGQSAPNPVLTTIRYFRDEYEAHIQDKRCPAHECKALLSYRINPLSCTGCTLCARKCPTSAITGKVKEAHIIDEQKCIKCDQCRLVCKFSAVEII